MNPEQRSYMESEADFGDVMGWFDNSGLGNPYRTVLDEIDRLKLCLSRMPKREGMDLSHADHAAFNDWKNEFQDVLGPKSASGKGAGMTAEKHLQLVSDLAENDIDISDIFSEPDNKDKS